MKFCVNDNCVGCGACCGICPNVFTMNDDGLALAKDGEVSETDQADAQDAMNSCPVGAISQQ